MAGLWTEWGSRLPMMDWLDSTGKNSTYEILWHNFRLHYETNRAPLGIYLHASWLATHGPTLKRFLAEVTAQYDDALGLTRSMLAPLQTDEGTR